MKFVCSSCENIVDEKDIIISTGVRIKAYCRKCYAEKKETLDSNEKKNPVCFGQYILDDPICKVCKSKEDCIEHRNGDQDL